MRGRRGGRATRCRSRPGPGCRTRGSPTCRARTRPGRPSRPRRSARMPNVIFIEPQDAERGGERERADRGEPEELHAELVEAAAVEQAALAGGEALRLSRQREEAERQRAPDAGHAVRRDGADRVVDARRARRAARRGRRSRRRRSRSRIAAHGATNAHAAVIATSAATAPFSIIERSGFLITIQDVSTAPSTPAGSREVRVQRDVREEADAAVVDAERRARVEAEPAEPEDDDAERREGHVVARDRVRLPVRAELPDARPEQQRPGERRPARPGSARRSSRRSPACPSRTASRPGSRSSARRASRSSVKTTPKAK